MTLSVNDFTAGDVITASAMNTNFATIEGYVNSSPGLAQLTGATFSGAVTFNGAISTASITTGSNGSGNDVTFYGDTTGNKAHWDASANALALSGSSALLRLVDLDADSAPYIGFYDNTYDGNGVTGRLGYVGYTDNDDLYLTNSNAGGIVKIVSQSTVNIEAASGITVDSKITFPATAPSDANINIEFAEGYKIYTDNTGSGTDNSRLWMDGPDTGEIVLGPRGGTEYLNRLRLRATTTLIEGAIDLNGNLDFAGTLSGTNSVPIVYYSHSGAAGSAEKVNDTPQIFVCTATPSYGLDDGDIWFDIS